MQGICKQEEMGVMPRAMTSWQLNRAMTSWQLNKDFSCWLVETSSFIYPASKRKIQAQQVKEIAEGLERSGHRFLWALRSPSNDKSRLPTDPNLDEVLPEGFLERIKERGMVWPSWAPQIEILAHPAVGGFVTHCGWNSSLESLWFGVPMLAWPLYAEQHLNAFEMGRVLGVALELELDSENGGFVRSEELERGVRMLMGESEEGKKVRRRVEEMKVASRKAVQAGGSSATALQSFMKKLISEMPT